MCINVQGAVWNAICKIVVSIYGNQFLSQGCISEDGSVSLHMQLCTPVSLHIMKLLTEFLSGFFTV